MVLAIGTVRHSKFQVIKLAMATALAMLCCYIWALTASLSRWMEYINMDLYLYSSDGYLGLVILLCFVRGVQLPADRGYVSSSVFVFVCVCWIAFVAAQRSFWYRSRNPLVALCVSNRCRRGAVLGFLLRDLDDEICFSGLAQRSWQEVSPRDIAEGSLRENLYRHFI